MITILLLLLMFIVIAMLWTEGLWGNALTFFNTFFSAMVATNYFEPAADFLEREVMPSYTYLLDFICLWGLFCFTYLVLRTTTDQISKHRVRFRLPVEIGGNVLFAFLTACVMVAFTSATLHTAPLARTAVAGSFQEEPMSGNFLGLAPGRKWLAFMQSRSAGALATRDVNVFDPKSEFVLKYGQRRQNLYDNMKMTGSMRVR